MKIILSIFSFMILSVSISAQCESWIDSPNKEEAENAHVVYRQYVKSKDYQKAFKSWQTAFNYAPAADGKRDWHFKDGIEIYKDKFGKATDKDKKNEYRDKVVELYETAAECYANGAITFSDCNEPECLKVKIGQLKGRQANDMYYTLLVPRAKTYKLLKEAVSLAGHKSEYIVLAPFGDLVSYLFTSDKITKEEARDQYKIMNDLADYNIANDENYAKYFQQGLAVMNAAYRKIEDDIFDCAYFVEKLTPDYELDPENIDNVKQIIAVLKRQGCQESEPFLAKLEGEYKVFAAEYNKERQAEFEANNPAMMASKMYKEGDFQGALDKYNEAIGNEADPDKLASYHFSIASIQGRKLHQNSAARASALKAASLKSGWGRPYMLIGDLYAKSSSSCGSDAYTRGLAVIAALDKWGHARNIDPNVAEDANRNISKFSQYLPPEDVAFMMGKKAGQTDKVGCWIGESVKLRFKG